MNRLAWVGIVASSILLLESCAMDSVGVHSSPDEYSPGYTGYTVMDEDYGISNGYGPAFWNPRYQYYGGDDDEAYGGRGFYGHGAYYGQNRAISHSGYYR